MTQGNQIIVKNSKGGWPAGVPKRVAPGVFQDEGGRFWSRPTIHHRRTWKTLKATKLDDAIKEAHTTDFEIGNGKFVQLADLYVEAGCPNKRLEARDEAFVEKEMVRVTSLKEFFSRFSPNEIRMTHCLAYKAFRIRKVKRGSGERTVDMDLNTLSNILNYGVATGVLEFNFIRSGRPRFRKSKDVRHCRNSAPANGDELHKIALFFFSRARSSVLGWLTLFTAMTGCRISEMLRLRVDAKNPDQPGFISGNYLFLGRRSKNGINPYALITDELREALQYFQEWHKENYPDSPWFFPGRLREEQKAELQPVGTSALNHGLNDAAEALGLPHRTPHGLRSFYVTKRRSDGVMDVQIAAEIGDKTVDLMHDTYGDRPPNWSGGEKLSWLPNDGEPAWKKWNVSEENVSETNAATVQNTVQAA